MITPRQRYYQRNKEKCAAACRRWEKKNPDAVSNSWLRRKYGISLNQWREIFQLQDGRCAICQDVDVSRWVVDHRHSDGKVRGILCSGCNTAIGHIRERPEALRNAAAYLEARN